MENTPPPGEPEGGVRFFYRGDIKNSPISGLSY